MEYYLLAWRNCSDFSGCSNRTEFWMFMLYHLVFTLIFIVIDVMTQSYFDAWYGVASLMPLVALIVRRLHDIQRSGWWCLLFIVPLFGPLLLLYWLALESVSNNVIKEAV
ncbi:DUF805 domain-containing protein [Vibrio vulnificus]|uniref:DUF805 domain-containing protein n=1 Tax=Vibrio vulnificus TaxID=672 RepID=A0A8H9TGP8_VIBVL|nr:DUF805 domain-containing protein [Vibrio vulnificus]ASM97403.1 hypothetical protein AOT11_20030 [Vibrio vulnificus NBRC 15645 = ATCC 27562]EGQ7693445.1 DUF805 domain-containing protein [Vibrio vulnificus]EGQ7757671.1 DUF805 domain-containing protein [Vibrio vulnificus]EGQ7964290.1 DUF805 domain-containing protein [Vibrio vulnificus]EGQ7998258.1 DUF805 domain-containing protein [Vibrio vulnificus]